MPKKVTYIISSIDRWIAFEWVHRQLNNEKFILSFVLINSGKSFFKDYLKKEKVQFTSL